SGGRPRGANQHLESAGPRPPVSPIRELRDSTAGLWKESILVASSTDSNVTANRPADGNIPRRISFAKIHEPLDVPNLLALQTDSFDRLVGNERWQARVQ